MNQEIQFLPVWLFQIMVIIVVVLTATLFVVWIVVEIRDYFKTYAVGIAVPVATSLGQPRYIISINGGVTWYWSPIQLGDELVSDGIIDQDMLPDQIHTLRGYVLEKGAPIDSHDRSGRRRLEQLQAQITWRSWYYSDAYGTDVPDG